MITQDIAIWLGRYFEEYLVKQRRTSRHTLHSYRDAWKLFLRYCCASTGKTVDQLSVNDAGSKAVTEFLTVLTEQRSNHISTRNLRLAAVKSFFRWLAMMAPEHLATCTRVLNIPKAKACRCGQVKICS